MELCVIDERIEQKENKLHWLTKKKNKNKSTMCLKKELDSLPDTGVEPVTSRLKVLRASQLRQSGLLMIAFREY